MLLFKSGALAIETNTTYAKKLEFGDMKADRSLILHTTGNFLSSLTSYEIISCFLKVKYKSSCYIDNLWLLI